MPENGAKSHLVNNGKAVQSAWLTHWTGTRSETIDHDRDFKRDLTGIEISSDNFGFSKDVDLTTSLKKPKSQSFQFFKRGQESGKRSMLNERVQALGLGPQFSHEKLAGGLNVEASSRACHVQPTNQVKHHMFFSESGYSSSQPSDKEVYKRDNHSTHGLENFRYLTAAFASKEHIPKNEMPSFSKQNNTPLLKTDPSTSSYRSQAFVEEQYKRMKKHIELGFFPRHTGSPQLGKSQTMHDAHFSSQNVPHFVHDVEMTKMSGGLHSFSRTTHSLLLTKQSYVKVYQENQFFRESRLSTQFKGEPLTELNDSPPRFGQGQQGVKLQLLDSSDHESQQNVEGYRVSGDVQKNLSSTDTDAMHMESFKDNHLSGVHLFPTDKDIMIKSTVEKEKGRKRKIEVSDINLEISSQPDASSSAEKAEPCMSRTQTLDMNKPHYNLDQTNSNSYECSNTNPFSEPGSRWIKRLKLAETSSSQGKLNTFFTRGVECKPKPESDSHHGKKLEILIGESSSVETNQECKEISLSHSWIQRWSHKQNQKNAENVETNCKMDDSEFERDEFQKKQFPSISAMALMGKAMTGLPQCKLQRKESFVVWDTKRNAEVITSSVLF
ncbi:hypothetical protein QVD17_27337 [Tagetes erecta]|uniref:Uncharacterized protein n=1 Tax=Tagetes erecta TaxID=13708 RepID=A0AAD8K8A5_TARER|nr:hypothetical protein QVD17_27337 [Tagetes erecta]